MYYSEAIKQRAGATRQRPPARHQEEPLMQEHPKRHGYLTIGSRVPKPLLRDSTAYEMGRAAAANGETLLSPSEFAEANAGYDLPTSTTGYIGAYAYYQRGYTTWHKERDADLRIGRCVHGALTGFCTHEDCAGREAS